jgi:hypothetical protein
MHLFEFDLTNFGATSGDRTRDFTFTFCQTTAEVYSSVGSNGGDGIASPQTT